MQKRPLAHKSIWTNFGRNFCRSARCCCRRIVRLFVVERQNGGHLAGAQGSSVEEHLVQVAFEGIMRRAEIGLTARHRVYRRVVQRHAVDQQAINVTTEK